MGTDRTPTTDVGSLLQSGASTDRIFAQQRGDEVTPVRFDRLIRETVDRCVAKQVAKDVAIASERLWRAA